MTKPVAWSFSSLESFETCPRRHFQTKVAKTVPDPMGEAALWGNKVHKALELRIKDHATLTGGMEIYEPLAAKLEAAGRGGKIEAEQKMCLNYNLSPTTYFAKDAWVRGITDITITKKDKAFIGDYKTGNPKPESAQLRLTAAMTMAHKPYVNTVFNSFIWLKNGTVTSETFTRDDIPKIWSEFAPRVQRLEIAHAETKWPPKPSGLCRNFCPCTGCEHNGNYVKPRAEAF